MPKILPDVVLILGASLAVVLLFRRLGLPSVAGFLLAGVVIGPSGLALVAHPADVRDIAEVGVALLLFSVGLDLSLRHMARTWRTSILAGGLQIVLTAAPAAIAIHAAGIPWAEADLLGFAVALSSTAVVLKSLGERGDITAPHGRVILGVLIFQDLTVVPLLAALQLASAGGGGGPNIALVLVEVAGVVAAVLLAGRYLLPPLLALAAGARSREVFTLAVITLVLGTAWMTSRAGLSLAIGAFLAGLLLSESEYGPQALADIFPVKETFTGLFFTSLGMLLDLRFVASHWVPVLALTAAATAGKAVLGAVACRIAQPSTRVAATAGVALAQVGEFALVLVAAGVSAGIVQPDRAQLLLAVSALTLLPAPLLAGAAHRWTLRVLRRLDARAGEEEAPEAERGCPMAGHVVVLGYGLNGRNLVRVLTETGLPHLALEMNPALVAEGRRAGHDVRYGDGTMGEVQRAAGIPCARVLVAAISDPLATRRVVSVARRLNPSLRIIVRTRFMGEIERLRAAGADEVVAEEFETSVEIFTRVLRELHVPRNVIGIQVDLVRREGYQMLRELRMPSRLVEQLPLLLGASAVDNVQLLEGSPAIGRSLAELGLRERTGASLVAVIREGRAQTNPAPDWRFALGDVLVLIGAHREVDAAERFLTRGE